MKLVPLSGIKVSGGAAMLRSSCVVPAPLVSFSLSPPLGALPFPLAFSLPSFVAVSL